MESELMEKLENRREPRISQRNAVSIKYEQKLPTNINFGRSNLFTTFVP